MSIARMLGFVVLTLAAYGQPAPELKVNQWLQAPAGFTGDWAALRGKVVVLEFWATWCAPCIKEIPHFNQLAQEFSGQDVVFLAVTDDGMNRLKPFLARQPIEAVIGLDGERKAWKAFAVPSIPHTVLVGKDGVVIGSTSPKNITSEVLREALAGKRPVLPPKEGVADNLNWDEEEIAWQDGVAPQMYAIIKPIKTTTGGVLPRPGHFTADGVLLRTLVPFAYQTDGFHLDWRVPEDRQTYRAAFRVPPGKENSLPVYMQQTLTTLFGLEAQWVDRETDVHVLRRLAGREAPAESRADKDLRQMMRGKITLRRQPIAQLGRLLANPLHGIVVDETGPNGVYDFDLAYQPGQPEMLNKTLADAGLEVVRARRSVRMLVVTSAP